MSYQGKASALGLKTGEPVRNPEHASNRWYELPISKSSSIVRCATGHDGQHAVFLDADGATFFTGLAKRGEDGDLSKFFIFLLYGKKKRDVWFSITLHSYQLSIEDSKSQAGQSALHLSKGNQWLILLATMVAPLWSQKMASFTCLERTPRTAIQQQAILPSLISSFIL